MNDDKILDCIVVATDCSSDDAVDSDDNENEANDPVTQELQDTHADESSEDSFYPNPSAQTLAPNARSSQSPKETRKAEALQSQVSNHSLEEHGLKCGNVPGNALDTSSGTAPTRPEFDLSIEKLGKLQETTPTTKTSPRDVAMTRDGPKRPQDSDSADERPRKRARHTFYDGTNEQQEPEPPMRSSPVLPLKSIGRSPPAKAQKGTTLPRQAHDAHQNHSTPTTHPRRKDAEVISTASEKSEHRHSSSSDEPLAVRRRKRSRNTAPAKVPTNEPADDSEGDMPISSTVSRRLRTRCTSSSDVEFDKPSPQSTDGDTDFLARGGIRPNEKSDNDQKQAQTIQDLKDQLAEASQMIDTYRQKFAKERAKGQDLEQQRLLLEAKRLNAQEEQEVVYKQLEAQLRYSESARTKLNEEIKDHISSNTKLQTDIRKLEDKVQKNEEQIESARRTSEIKAEELRKQVESLQANTSEELSKRLKLESLVREFVQRNLNTIDRETAMKSQISELLSSQEKSREKLEQLETQFQSKLESSVTTRTQELSKKLDQRQATIEQNTQQAEDLQEELDWYKNQLEKERKQFEEDWDARNQLMRRLLADAIMML